ncbi:Glucose-6-phosphate 1-epimerase [Madurella mycetomatis]|uniref:Glucose-6-phosphate 1-epimerase n=1 Tax=Madurella mycetomatis TaxID=100816 RepID=A0A175WHA3_9PEZI|nr:Glucose-6-phosphate 1-epimerase [Madurella mycetomatis]
MVERATRPPTLSATPGLPPQPTVTFSDDNSRVTAELPTGESVVVLLYGATVISWKDARGEEKLWLSEVAALDGSRPVFGAPPSAAEHPQTSRLPQHGFARTSRWEFLGKSTSESLVGKAAADGAVKLDFGLSSGSEGLDERARQFWPFKFNLIYSVLLSRESLTTSIVATNDDGATWDCHVLMHTYLRVKDITKVEVTGLDKATYIDKVDGAKTKTQSEGRLTITGETDRVYTPVGGPRDAVNVIESGETTFSVTRDNLSNVVVWNPWADKAASMADFAPDDGYKNMLCVEPGSVSTWQSVESGDAFDGAQTITIKVPE